MADDKIKVKGYKLVDNVWVPITEILYSNPILANALTNGSVTIKSGAGILTSYYIYNPNSSVAYVQFFDSANAVVPGTTTPAWSIGIPATSAANLSGLRLRFLQAIKVIATTTATGSSAPTTALDANFGYE